MARKNIFIIKKRENDGTYTVMMNLQVKCNRCN